MSNHDDIQKKLESFEQETFAKLHVQSGGDEMAAVLDLDQANERTPATFADLGGPPTTTDVKLGLPIDVDFSEPLREYTLGHRGSAKKVQWVVRGHWRNQACGVELKEHRRTWIKPYWKGPAHLPILVRPHVLGEKDDA